MSIFKKIITWFSNKQTPSSIETWAEKEIQMVIEKENIQPNSEDPMDRYAIACYQSALKALKCLAQDRHSGMSIQVTKQILDRLIDWKPLTAVEDKPEEWSDIIDEHDYPVLNKQHKRYGSLFKYENIETGEVYYRDYGRCRCVDVQKDMSYTFGLVTDLIHQLYPIQMPYFPTDEPLLAYCGEALSDPKNGDFDTFGIFYLIMPDKERVEINKFYAEKQEDEGGWVEIDSEEWIRRVAATEARKTEKKKKYVWVED